MTTARPSHLDVLDYAPGRTLRLDQLAETKEAVQEKLAELMGEPCDEVFPEYVLAMVTNGKTIRDICTQLEELLSPSTAEVFSMWLGKYLLENDGTNPRAHSSTSSPPTKPDSKAETRAVIKGVTNVITKLTSSDADKPPEETGSQGSLAGSLPISRATILPGTVASATSVTTVPKTAEVALTSTDLKEDRRRPVLSKVVVRQPYTGSVDHNRESDRDRDTDRDREHRRGELDRDRNREHRRGVWDRARTRDLHDDRRRARHGEKDTNMKDHTNDWDGGRDGGRYRGRGDSRGRAMERSGDSGLEKRGEGTREAVSAVEEIKEGETVGWKRSLPVSKSERESKGRGNGKAGPALRGSISVVGGRAMEVQEDIKAKAKLPDLRLTIEKARQRNSNPMPARGLGLVKEQVSLSAEGYLSPRVGRRESFAVGNTEPRSSSQGLRVDGGHAGSKRTLNLRETDREREVEEGIGLSKDGGDGDSSVNTRPRKVTKLFKSAGARLLSAAMKQSVASTSTGASIAPAAVTRTTTAVGGGLTNPKPKPNHNPSPKAESNVP
ncbi:unnamed protein product, partial [Discosporangium mesarthrocarpum]